ncbi:UAA transporter [Trametes cingulata]|nr:UAA transporter [Trametes cingulata]
MSASEILRGLTLGVVSDWATTLALIFGGCCSNALTLEQLTRTHPHAGALITFAQFVLVSAAGLPTFLSVRAVAIPVPRLRARRTPLAPYLAQVALFYAVSLLNNAAFGYSIPMPVHIIFRSGGLVVSMLMGWLIAGKRYNVIQVLSVLLVTAGVVLTTLSASAPKGKSPKASSATSPLNSTSTSHTDTALLTQEQWRYATGIALLTLALVLSGLLGIVQDWTYARYVRAPQSAAEAETSAAKNGDAKVETNGHTNGHANGHSNGHSEKSSAPVPGKKASTGHTPQDKPAARDDGVEPWQESMFYLHFLSLPMFLFVRHDLAAQARALAASPPLRLRLSLPLSSLPHPLARALTSVSSALTLYPPFGLSRPLFPLSAKSGQAEITLPFSAAHLALALTAATALVCAAGVHRLTGRGVSALAVTLLLVVRKAASLVLSVVLFRAGHGAVNGGVWAGAGMVFVGTLGYAVGSSRGRGKEKEKKE